MKSFKNEAGGKSLVLVEGDSLDAVPKPHREIITPRIREVFADPPGYFGQIADVCPFPQMAAWLRALLEEDVWYLALHRSDQPQWTAAGFGWPSEAVLGAEISPSTDKAPQTLPATMRKYYSLVDQVQWMDFGCSGGLDGAGGETPLTIFPQEYHGAAINPAETFVFGWSLCGDRLVYTKDRRGGWCCHENGKVHLLGTIEDTINWVYAELLAGRAPEFDYSWA